MAKGTDADLYQRPLRRFLLAVLIILLVALILLWRIDNPRAERLRAQMVDAVVPNMEWAMVPITRLAGMIDDFQGYARVYEQNQELRRELQEMKAWREAATQLEQENARLLDLNNMQLSPQLTFIGGVVLTDAGSPFRRSVLLNIGAEDGIRDGWAAIDGLGLVGRISGVGQSTSRVILVTDSNSRIPVVVQPSGTPAFLAGDTTSAPPLDFLERSTELRAGDRVVTSGDGGVFPPDILVGQLVQTSDRRWRVRLAADMERLEFLRILRSRQVEQIDNPGQLVRDPDRAPDLIETPDPDAEDQTPPSEG